MEMFPHFHILNFIFKFLNLDFLFVTFDKKEKKKSFFAKDFWNDFLPLSPSTFFI